MTKLIRQPEMFINVAMILLSGCSTIASSPASFSFEIHESFTHEEIVGGKMGIGGVVSVANDVTGPEAARYAHLLRETLMTERRDFEVLPVEEVRRRMGSNDHQAILEEYAQSGRLSLTSLKEAQAMAGASRYIIFARIIDNRVEETCHEYIEEDWAKHLPAEDREESAGKENTWVKLTTTRHTTVSIDVYDLSTTISVFHGVFGISESASKEYAKTEDKNMAEMFLRIPTHAFLQTALQPKPPTSAILLDKVFAAFSNNMP